MLYENERSKFLYETKKLTPGERRKMAIGFISKTKDLLEQELIIDAMYAQMDYKTMDNLTKEKYKQAQVGLQVILDRLG